MSEQTVLVIVQPKIPDTYRMITKICDWAKYDNRLYFKKYVSDETVLLSK